MLEAMRAGCQRVRAEPITAHVARRGVRRLLVSEQREPLGQVFAFVGAKGGVGTTTLAVNTAAALGRAQSDVLLVDLHLGHGDAALFSAPSRASRSSTRSRTCTTWTSRSSAAWSRRRRAASICSASPVGRAPCAVDQTSARARCSTRPRGRIAYRAGRAALRPGDARVARPRHRRSSSSPARSCRRCATRPARRHAAAALRPQRVRVVVNRYDKTAVIAQEDVERVIGERRDAPIPERLPGRRRGAQHGPPDRARQDSRLARPLRTLAMDLGGLRQGTLRRRPAGVLGPPCVGGGPKDTNTTS